MAATATEAAPFAWIPHTGSQEAFLACPLREVLYEGSRGPGKSDALLMDFAQFVGRGYGPAWRGVLFRMKVKDLEDLISKSKRWFFRLFPGIKWLSSKTDYKWVWPTGEELLLRAAKHPDDYWDYHGHEYPWVGWDELTNWPSMDLYDQMHSVNRSSVPGLPRRYRSAANPWGAGHGWVRQHFVDPGPPGTPIRNGEGELRVRIHGDLAENTHLEEHDPQYVKRIRSVKNPELRKAWVDGDWDVNPGGFLMGVWNRSKHAVKPFPIPVDWKRWRAMDWGFAKPYSIGWYAMDFDGRIFRYRELYGWGGRPDVGTRQSASEVAREVLRLEGPERRSGVVFSRNPADSEIFSPRGVEQSVADLFALARPAEGGGSGVQWMPAEKGPGSRVTQAGMVVDALQEGRFFVFESCRHWLRTVPALQMDPDNWEDVDTEQEDHTWDETRYSLASRHVVHKPPPKPKRPAPGTFDAITQNPRPTSRYRRRALR